MTARPAGCTCAHNADGTATATLCPFHADTDPCLTVATVTGRRRRGSIVRGTCTACGWRAERAPELERPACAYLADVDVWGTRAGCACGWRALESRPIGTAAAADWRAHAVPEAPVRLELEPGRVALTGDQITAAWRSGRDAIRAAWALWRECLTWRGCAALGETPARHQYRDPAAEAAWCARMATLERRRAVHYLELARTGTAPAGSSWDPRSWGLA